MQHIDPVKISDNLSSSIEYLQSFLPFDPNVDGLLIHVTKPVLSPLVNTIIDAVGAVYDHLLKYAITAAAFAPTRTEGHRSAPNK